MSTPDRQRSHFLFRAAALVTCLALAACTLPFGGTAGETTPVPPTPAPLPAAETTFVVTLPSEVSADLPVYFDVLDEVTGLALNPLRYPMVRVDSVHYGLRLPVTAGSVVKYRYALGGDHPAVEYTASGRQVRYRLATVSGAGIIFQDKVSTWSGQNYSGQTGRITGKVTDSSSNSPVPGLMVNAAGETALTASDGSFTLEGIAPGTHNLVVYALDGAYRTFQQGAAVAGGATTPAEIRVEPAPLVNVAFIVAAPHENVVGVPMRLAGNLDFLGNTFTDLEAGLSTVASRMPTLSLMPDGSYSITLALHAGTDLRYKYTFGDGFWNSELNADGSFRIRQYIVPEQNAVVQDTITTWQSPGAGPVTFDVNVPADTPAGDTISIQFNPYAWTPPLPMWSMGDGRWVYILDSPLHLVKDLAYRICRNDQCGSADDAATAGPNAAGIPFKVTDQPQNLQHQVAAWAWWVAPTAPTSVAAAEILPRGADFTAGVQFQPNSDPTWQARYAQAFKDVAGIGANWVYLTPAWTFTGSQLPTFELVPGKDPLWQEVLQAASQARGESLSVALYPTAHFRIPMEQWWQDAPRGSVWWQGWFDRYEDFALNFADLAKSSGASALVLGGDWLAPALPDGKLPDGTPSDVPADAAARWSEILTAVRARFPGELIWATSYPHGLEKPPDFLDGFDRVLVEVATPISAQPNPGEDELTATLGEVLDGTVRPFEQALGKPLLLGVAFPSAAGALSACPPAPDGGCLSLEALSRPNPDIPTVNVDLQAQVTAYNALFAAINSRDWVDGVVSQGYYPPAALQDKSTSVHGKPAQDVLWYWNPRLLASP